MMKMNVSDIAAATDAKWTGQDIELNAVSIDTRSLNPGDLYIAIKGERFDGHDFIDAAIQAGAGAVMVMRPVVTDVPQIVVNDTREALADLAKTWRRRLSLKVVGITGSNGKTSVKEMTASLLKQAGQVLYTHGNLNNDLGVPLTLLKITPQHDYAVVEMGANHAGEIAFTSQLAQPHVAVLNNAGPAHLEGFGSLQGVAMAKGELIDSLAEDGVAVLNRDDAFFDYWQQRAGGRKVLSFGFHEAADVRALNIRQRLDNGCFVTDFTMKTEYLEMPITLALAGEHNVRNALAASAATMALGLDAERIQQGLADMQPVAGRLTPMMHSAGGLLLDDSYNANPASVAAALKVLTQKGGEPWVVLGALGEMGEDSPDIHRKLGALMKTMGIEKLFATGADAEYAVEAFGNGGTFFQSQQTLIETLQQTLTAEANILVKGSRAQQMEKVVAVLTNNDGN